MRRPRTVPKQRFKLAIVLAAQVNRMHPTLTASIRRGKLNVTGSLSPGPSCGTYEVRITYDQEKGTYAAYARIPYSDDIPHKYGRDGDWVRVCLHLPGVGDWRPAEHGIADTVVPWLVEWLFFYEIWLATGDWLGGGEHPQRGGK